MLACKFCKVCIYLTKLEDPERTLQQNVERNVFHRGSVFNRIDVFYIRIFDLMLITKQFTTQLILFAHVCISTTGDLQVSYSSFCQNNRN